MKRFLSLCLFLYFSAGSGQDLDSLMRSLETQKPEQPVISTFKSTKLILQQTHKTQQKQQLTFWVAHRFGDIGGEAGGSHTLYGLDASTDIHIGFDYGISDALSVGIGRSKFNETYNLQAKYSLLRQRLEGVPVSISLFGQGSWITRESYFTGEFPEEADRISYFLQAILARKFSPGLSLMLNPGYIIRPQVADPMDRSDFFVLGMGGRMKLTKRLSITVDYVWVKGLHRPAGLEIPYYNPLGIGLEIETGGHVFSLNFQNSAYITGSNFIPNTHSSWTDGGVRFGFSISRDFYLGPRERKGWPVEEE